jgi:hypothetical protein
MKRPTSTEVAIPDGSRDDTSRRDRHVIDQFIKVPFLGYDVGGTDVGALHRHRQRFNLLVPNDRVHILRVHGNILPLRSTRRVERNQYGIPAQDFAGRSEEPDLLWYNRGGESTMSMIGLTPEQRRLMEQAGDQPVRIEDPEMQQTYVLIRAEVYEQVRDLIEPRSDDKLVVPEGIRRSQEAFFRDLPT